jgi:transmembrane sensor
MSETGKNIDWELAARVLNGEGDEIDRGLLEQWLKSDKANAEEWGRINDSWKKGDDFLFLNQIDTDAAWDNVHRYTSGDSFAGKPQSRFSLRNVLAVAASVVLVLGLSWFFLINQSVGKSSLIVSNTSREEMVLSDGSRITLNDRSKFSCEQPFSSDERVVQLNGEGYFDVQGNLEWPFIIHTGDVTIRVTGTSFNVRAYPNLDITEIAVLEGRVEVIPPSMEDMVILTQGQTAYFDKKSRMLSVHESTDPNILSWITQQIRFEETSLLNVTETLERVYGVNIQLSDDVRGQQRLTASFSDNSLNFVLEVVCTTFNLKTQREGETIFLTSTSEQ